MTIAIVFPGQGSQKVGMGKALADAYPAARAVHEEIDEALGHSLSKLMWEGPEDDLTLTENAQPAIMAASLAALKVLEAETGFDLAARASFVAGHSLGEYSALAAAGTFSLADTARLLRTRGQAMQKAVPVGEGAMAALLGLDFEVAAEVAAQAAEGEVCQPANDNAPGQVVVSGASAAVERAVEIAKEKGARRAMMLQVSAPFHCALMAPAADVMASALAEVQMSEPAVPLVSNVTASAVRAVEDIRLNLVEQVTGLVRWRESIAWLAGEGVDTVVEVGTGRVLSGLVKRIDGSLQSGNFGAPDELEAVAGVLGC